MKYQKDDLIKLLERKQILDHVYLKKGTLVYINEIDGNMLNVSEIDSSYDWWMDADNTKLVERT